VEVPHNIALNPGGGDFTWEFWVRPIARTSAWWDIFMNKGSGDNRIYFGIWGTSPPAGYYRGSLTDENSVSRGIPDELPGAQINLNTWTHLAFVLDRSIERFNLYRDGNYVGGVALGTFGSVSPEENLYFASKPGEPFKGFVDEVRIYARALTAAEIQKHYVEGLESHQYARK